MKKSITLGIVLLLILVAVVGCADTRGSANSQTESLFEITKGVERKDIHAILGEPLGMLSGFFGDVYLLDNGTKITVYYDGDEKVENVLIADKDENITFSSEQSE